MSGPGPDGPEERPGLPLGRAGGVPVFLRPSWFLVAVVVTVTFAPTVRRQLPELGVAAGYGIGLAFAVLLLLSVFVHEVAHAAAARRAGTPATHIVLDLWGGHTAFGQDAKDPWRSLLVAAVGPLSNALLCLAAWALLELATPEGVAGLLLAALGYANGVVAVFNALPGLPLDGGRVLEALVWRVSGDRTLGTVTAGWAGRAVAVALLAGVAVPALTGRPLGWVASIWLLVVAWLLWSGASGAMAYGRWLRQAGMVSARDLLRPAVAVSSTSTLADVPPAGPAGEDPAVVVLDIYGRPASIVDPRAAAGVPAGRVAEVRAAAVADALPHGAVIEHDLAGTALLERLQGRPAARYVVVEGDPGGSAAAVVGVLEWDDVARFVTGR